MNSPGRQFTFGLKGTCTRNFQDQPTSSHLMTLTICDVSGLGTPCSPTAAAAPPPAAPLVAADELDDGLLAKVRDELDEGREREVYLGFYQFLINLINFKTQIPHPILLSSLCVRGSRLMYLYRSITWGPHYQYSLDSLNCLPELCVCSPQQQCQPPPIFQLSSSQP